MKKRLVAAFVCILLLSGNAGAVDRENIVRYVYEDNKKLVMLVEDAADLIEKTGEEAFKEFGKKNSIWFTDKYYLFVYDSNGVCVFHPIEKDFVGRNLSQFKDIGGRPAISMILDIGKMPQPDASGWVFYLWEDQFHSYPKWKGSYIRKAIAPDGKIYLVGSGLYNIKIEKVFIQEQVDAAAKLILSEGKEAAFKRLNEQSCPMHILGSYVSVVAENGDVIVDPLFPNMLKKRNMAGYLDATGKNVFKEMVSALKDQDSVWALSVERGTSGDKSVRHLRYTRKVVIGDGTFYVTSSFAPATPVWMKQ